MFSGFSPKLCYSDTEETNCCIKVVIFVFFPYNKYSCHLIKFRLNPGWQMDYFDNAFHTFLGLDSVLYLVVNRTVTSLPVFIQNKSMLKYELLWVSIKQKLQFSFLLWWFSNKKKSIWIRLDQSFVKWKICTDIYIFNLFCNIYNLCFVLTMKVYWNIILYKYIILCKKKTVVQVRNDVGE